MRKNLLITFIFLAQIVFAQHAPTGNQVAGSSLNSAQWLEDVGLLQREILRIHPNPFHTPATLNKAKYDSLFNELKTRAAEWSSNKLITEIARIIGSLNDGHSTINILNTEAGTYTYKFFPVLLNYFDEGIYVLNITKQYEHLKGYKLIAINNSPVKDAINKLKPLISKDWGNESSFKDAIRFFLITSEYLNGLDIIDNPDEATFYFEDEKGNKSSVSLHSVPANDLFSSFSPAETEKPLYLQNERDYYWFKYLEHDKSLYIKYTFQLEDSKLPLAQFCYRLQSVLDSVECKKIILDLRQGQGGNIGTMGPMYQFLLQPKVNQCGKLYVLQDRRSQSASAVLAVRLSMISKAIFIGEPSVTATNFFDNDRKVILPNSKLKIGISSHYQQASFPIDKRIALDADIFKQVTAKDYFAKKDPVLEYALQHKAEIKQPIEIKANDKNEGLYEYSLLKVLHVVKEDDNWRMYIEGGGATRYFLNTALYPISATEFTTDVRGLTVSISGNTLALHTMWGDMNLNKLSPDYKTPEEMLQSGNIDNAISTTKQLYTKAGEKEKKDFETIINSWGYQLISSKDPPNALKLFKLNSELFPGSANVWDSLGEANALAGNKEEAIRNYQKALELTPGLISATKALEKLQQ
ncbi:MAG: tetratricopeptide repeat protein [Ferruginibacter sp.]